MRTRDDSLDTRRRFMALVGGGLLFTPLFGLRGCGGKEDANRPVMGAAGDANTLAAKGSAGAQSDNTPSAEGQSANTNTNNGSAQQASSQPSGADGSMPRVSEDDPQAKNLAYVHNAEDVIASEQPRYQSGQHCGNCQLYQGSSGEEWGACPLFSGKQVKKTGWCNAYAPAAG